MATRKGFPRRARLVWTLPIQNLNVQRKFPQFRYSKHRECGMWSGWLQPTDFSPKYAVQVQYEVDDIPKVHVLSPILHPKAVHLYADKRLCLFWPKEWIWRPDRLISDTIIPWTGSWLFFYEIWLDTDKWLGPSSHEIVQ